MQDILSSESKMEELEDKFSKCKPKKPKS